MQAAHGGNGAAGQRGRQRQQGRLWPSQRTQATPTSPLTTLPPITDQGCASGLAGRANSSTEEAPIGATRRRRGSIAAAPG
jgi:hypothetical protein